MAFTFACQLQSEPLLLGETERALQEPCYPEPRGEAKGAALCTDPMRCTADEGKKRVSGRESLLSQLIVVENAYDVEEENAVQEFFSKRHEQDDEALDDAHLDPTENDCGLEEFSLDFSDQQ